MPRRSSSARSRLARLAAPLLLLPAAACVTHTHCTDVSGIPGLRGEPVEYQSSTSWALHGLFVFPLIGDATLDDSVAAFTKEASGRGGKRFDLVQHSTTYYWFVLPPLSFFIHPVATEVAGQIELPATAK